MDGARYIGVQSIKWTQAMEGAEMVPGAANVPIAETEGTYKATAEIELLWSEYVSFMARRRGKTTRFNIGAQVQDVGLGLSSLIIPKCRIIGADGSLEANKAAVWPLKLSVMGVITLGGVPAMQGFAATSGNQSAVGAAGGAVASISASLGGGISLG